MFSKWFLPFGFFRLQCFMRFYCLLACYLEAHLVIHFIILIISVEEYCPIISSLCHFIFFQSKHFPQPPVLKNRQSKTLTPSAITNIQTYAVEHSWRSQRTNNPEWGSLFSPVLPDKCHNITLNRTTTNFINILPNSLFTIIQAFNTTGLLISHNALCMYVVGEGLKRPQHRDHLWSIVLPL
jgi:hypothetical protein